MREMI